MGVKDCLWERAAVTDSVESLVGAVAAGRGAALLVVGEAGLGKTAVLRHGRDVAARAGLQVGSGGGHPMETALPFGLLAQALQDLGAGGLLADPTAGAAVVDRAARFYGVLRWLEQHAGPRALLVLDDLHWADADSLALFCFICRRIAGTAAGVLAAMRPWPAEALQAAQGLAHEGCATLERLAPLSDPGRVRPAGGARRPAGSQRDRPPGPRAVRRESAAAGTGRDHHWPRRRPARVGRACRGPDRGRLAAGALCRTSRAGPALRPGGVGAGHPLLAGTCRTGGRAERARYRRGSGVRAGPAGADRLGPARGGPRRGGGRRIRVGHGSQTGQSRDHPGRRPGRRHLGRGRAGRHLHRLRHRPELGPVAGPHRLRLLAGAPPRAAVRATA